MKFSVNNQYKVLQGLFWMQFCVSAAFISLYLQGRGLNNAEIGTVTAVFGTLAALIQPLLGGISDRNSRFTWRNMILLMAVPFLAICILMPFISAGWASAVFIGLLMLLSNVMLPFMNSAHFYYVHAGEYINFGVARGIGSVTFALTALLIGALAEKIGIEAVPLSGILIALLFIFVLLRMPYTKEVAPTRHQGGTQAGFLKRYPAFGIMLLACLLMLTTHSIVNIYMLQIIQSIGGHSSQLGIALAVQALVEVPILFGFSLLNKRFHSSALMLIASISFTLKAVLYFMSGSVVMIYLTQITQMFSYAIFAPASVFYTSESIAQEDQTTGQAYMSSMFAAATVLGGLLGGWVLELSGMKTLLTVNMVIGLLAVVLVVFSLKKQGSLRKFQRETTA